MSVESNSPYTVFIDEAERRVAVLDQRLLPHRVEYVDLKNAQEAAEAIRDMTVRGAPLIGVTGAAGMALAADESTETGFLIEDYLAILPQLDDYKNLCVRGLMVIAPLCGDIEETRPVFKEGYRCFCELRAQRPGIELLSMGMTHDFTVAVEEGANIVRVGTALFGKRDYSKNK